MRDESHRVVFAVACVVCVALIQPGAGRVERPQAYRPCYWTFLVEMAPSLVYINHHSHDDQSLSGTIITHILLHPIPLLLTWQGQ